MFLSTGLVNTVTKDQVDLSTGRNTSATANLSYSLPRRPLAFQLWATLSSVKNDSRTVPADNSSLSLNLETVWMKSRASRFTFGIGTLSKKDDLGASAGTTELNVLTRYNYSF